MCACLYSKNKYHICKFACLDIEILKLKLFIRKSICLSHFIYLKKDSFNLKKNQS